MKRAYELIVDRVSTERDMHIMETEDLFLGGLWWSNLDLDFSHLDDLKVLQDVVLQTGADPDSLKQCELCFAWTVHGKCCADERIDWVRTHA